MPANAIGCNGQADDATIQILEYDLLDRLHIERLQVNNGPVDETVFDCGPAGELVGMTYPERPDWTRLSLGYETDDLLRPILVKKKIPVGDQTIASITYNRDDTVSELKTFVPGGNQASVRVPVLK